ncbi:MAG: STAS domain-containing protein [Nocardioidaceae bacterium]
MAAEFDTQPSDHQSFSGDRSLSHDRPQLDIDVSPHEVGALVRVSGQLDFSNAHRLLEAVRGVDLNGRRHVVLDLSRLTFCDARGLSVVLRADRLVRAEGGQLSIRGPTGLPRRLFGLVGVDQALDLE